MSVRLLLFLSFHHIPVLSLFLLQLRQFDGLLGFPLIYSHDLFWLSAFLAFFLCIHCLLPHFFRSRCRTLPKVCLRQCISCLTLCSSWPHLTSPATPTAKLHTPSLRKMLEIGLKNCILLVLLLAKSFHIRKRKLVQCIGVAPLPLTVRGSLVSCT